MLSINRTAVAQSETPKCSPNTLPCRIHHNGPVNANKRYWDPKEDGDDQSRTAYFRGRKLKGREVKVPEGYRGVMLNRTDRIVQIELEQKQPEQIMSNEVDDNDEDVEGSELPEEVTALDEVANFDSFMVWGHEVAPDERDTPLVRGVSEWVKFAQAMHACDPDTRPDVPEQR